MLAGREKFYMEKLMQTIRNSVERDRISAPQVLGFAGVAFLAYQGAPWLLSWWANSGEGTSRLIGATLTFTAMAIFVVSGVIAAMMLWAGWRFKRGSQ
jgi:hypothetical protein